jgi:LacI family transcriptional regulator
VSRLKSTHRVNIAEVAAAAGVSVGTVSRVLNESPNVRDGTRQRVLEVMRRMHYRPSRLATRLSRGSPRTVVLLVPFLTRPSVVARLAGAIGVLDEQGFDAVLCNIETPAQLERHVLALTARHGADGAVVMSLRLSRHHLTALRDARLPLAMVDTEAPGVPCTVVDDVRGGFLAAKHLIDLGHRRIGFVGDRRDPDLDFVSTRRRLLGYRRALAGSGLGYDPALVRLGEHAAAAAAALTLELLRLAAPPTAIFAASDTQALGVIAAAEKSGRSVPADLSVVGYDDIDSAAQLGLSTVRQPLAESGARGASRLCAVLRGEAVRPLREELPLAVVARSSTAPLKCWPRPPSRDGPAAAALVGSPG